MKPAVASAHIYGKKACTWRHGRGCAMCQPEPDFGVTPALLVVANWHGRWPLHLHPTFTAWLRACAARRAEVFLYAAARDAGIQLGEDAAGVRLLTLAVHVAAPAVRWSSRTATRARVSALTARSRWHLRRRRSWIRLALHPQDLQHPTSAHPVYSEVRRWLGLGTIGRYADL